MKASHKVRARFDDPNLVSTAGLVPVMRLAQSVGLSRLVDDWVTVASPNRGVKVAGIVAGMLAGADSIDDLGLLRHGGMGRVFEGVRAPSTLGTFLRLFTIGQVRQLDAVGSRLLTGLGHQVHGVLPDNPAGLVFVDIDDTMRQVHGYRKQAAAFGHVTGVRGLNVQLAAVSGPGRAPVITQARLRRGNATSIQGAASFVTAAVGATRRAGVAGQVMVRADAGYYGTPFVTAAIRAQAWFSVTAKHDPAVTRAIAGIPDDAWTAIQYPNAVWDHEQGRYISDAEVAETDYTAFTRNTAGRVACRLVVRRVRRLHHDTDPTQPALFDAYRYHAFITNSTLPTVAADAHHRDHAIVEQVIAELKQGPLAHLPSGNYAANAAWVACAVMAFNLARAAAVAAAMPTARWATVRMRIINVPARLAQHARQLILHLPQQWAWAHHWLALHTTTGPPLPTPS